MKFPTSLAQRWHSKRFRSFNGVLRDHFGERVYKIGLRMDFTCPNRDGNVAVGGCIYCNNASHTAQDYRPRTSVTEQLEKGALAIARRHKAEKFIAYFQSYTNTYDDTAKLARLYEEALLFPGVVGLSIATRPDCLPDATLDLLTELSQQTYLWLEVGLESMYDRTLAWVNRGHTLSAFVDAAERAKARGLRLCAHLILGFPGESRNDMLRTTRLFTRLELDGIKLHNLHVIKNTPLEKFYQAGQVPLLSCAEYVDLVVDFLERLNPETVIHRLSGETYRELTVAPEWSIDKIGVQNAIFKAFEARDTWQGRLFPEANHESAAQKDLHELEGAAF